MTFMGGTLSRQQTQNHLQRLSTSKEVDSENWWMVCQKSTMKPIGFIWTMYDLIEKSVSLNIVIKPEFQKQGIASNALNALMQYAYENMDIRQFMIYVPSDHKPAKKLMRSLDMKFKKYLFRKGKSFELYSRAFDR